MPEIGLSMSPGDECLGNSLAAFIAVDVDRRKRIPWKSVSDRAKTKFKLFFAEILPCQPAIQQASKQASQPASQQASQPARASQPASQPASKHGGRSADLEGGVGGRRPPQEIKAKLFSRVQTLLGCFPEAPMSFNGYALQELRFTPLGC